LQKEWPVSNTDDRLQPREKILGIEVDGVYKAYSLTKLTGMINDNVGDIPLVVFSTETESGFIYVNEVDGKNLLFYLKGDIITDLQTDSQWTLSGKAVEGPSKGIQLTPYPSAAMYWFAWSTIHPDTRVSQ